MRAEDTAEKELERLWDQHGGLLQQRFTGKLIDGLQLSKKGLEVFADNLPRRTPKTTNEIIEKGREIFKKYVSSHMFANTSMNAHAGIIHHTPVCQNMPVLRSNLCVMTT
jgi:hypothetical protein